MNKKEKDDYIVLFQQAKLSKHEANKVGLGLIFGVIGVIICAIFLGPDHKFIGITLCIIFAIIGYLWVGNKVFKK